MEHHGQQRFCTACGQPLTAGAAFCVSCGAPVNAPLASGPGQVFAEAPGGGPLPGPQTSMPGQGDMLLAGLAAGAEVRGRGRSLRRTRWRGCGYLLLILVVLTGPFLGLALTSGRLHQVFVYMAGGIVALFLLLLLVAMLATRRGREVVAEGCTEGCLEALLGGFLGG